MDIPASKDGDSPKTKLSRRGTLKIISVAGIQPFSVLDSAVYSGAQAEYEQQSIDLLPADDVGGERVQETASPITDGGDLGEVDVDDEIMVDPNGTISNTIAGVLEGPGTLALSGSPFIETSWIAPRDGLYRISAEYTATANVQQRPFSEDTTEIASTIVSNSGTVDSTQTVVRDRSRHEWSLRNRRYSEEILENLLGILAKRLLTPFLGPLGAAISGFILEVVFDLLVDAEGEFEIERSWEDIVSSDFMAEKGESYQLQFTTTSGISGQSESPEGGFDAMISTEYDLDEFRLRPVSGLPESEIVVYQTGNGGYYDFDVTGSLRGGEDLEPMDSVDTRSPLFSNEESRHASGSVRSEGDRDTYYFTGEIADWSLNGSAKMFVNGERWFPYGGGPEEHEIVIEHAGNGGYYDFDVTGSLRGGEGLEPMDSVDTRSPLFSNEETRHASGSVRSEGDRDTYYFTGEITDWSLNGSAKVYINGERWFPHG